MDKSAAIRRVPGLVGGRPTVPGRRLTAYDLVSQSCCAADEAELRVYLADFGLSMAELQVAVGYCAGLQCLAPPGGPFCVGCCLQFQQEGSSFTADELAAMKELSPNDFTQLSSSSGSFFIFGSLADCRRDAQGRAGWLMAASVQHRYGYLLAHGSE